MAGFIVTTAASPICTHGAAVTAAPGSARVRAGGAPVATLADQFAVAGCPFQVPIPTGTKPQPCVAVRWIAPAVRVRVDRQPVILQMSSGICQSVEQIPQGPPTVVSTQARVKGT
jgi:hypothetical protein